MNTKIRCLLALLGLGIVDAFIPVPMVALILVFVIVERPSWFRKAVQDIYEVDQ